MKSLFPFLLAVLPVAAQLAAQSDLRLYDIDQVTTIRLSLPDAAWKERLHELKDKEVRLPASADVNGHMFDSVGLRYKGNSSYHAPLKRGKEKFPFNIKFDFKEDGQALPGGHTKLKLSNAFRDPSFLREVLAYEIAARYMPASRANFAQLYINEEYQGLYHSVESVDEDFLQNHFGQDEGRLIKCDPVWKATRPPDCQLGDGKASLRYLGEDPACYQGVYEPKSDSVWDALIRLTRILEKEPGKIESILNVDQALWMLAFNNLIVNLDSYLGALSHNYYLYQDTAGIFHPIIWDLNLAFGGFRLDGSGQVLDKQELQTLSMFLHYKQRNPDRPLITRLLEQDHYRKVYLAHVRTMLEEVFLSGWFEERARELHGLIYRYVQEDPLKLYSTADFNRNLDATVQAGNEPVIGLFELMRARVDYLSNHPLLTKPVPAIVEAGSMEDASGRIRFSAIGQDTDRAWLMLRPLGSRSAFRRIAMAEESLASSGPIPERAWSHTLPGGSDWEYYFVFENEHSARLMPERAGHEFLTTATDLKD